jgi:hypothetical protein
MGILAETKCYFFSAEEAQRLTAAHHKEVDQQYGPQWLKRTCWYFAFPIGIVGFGLWFQNLMAGVASFFFFWGVGAGSNALYHRISKKNNEAQNGPRKGTEWQIILEDDVLIARSNEKEERYKWSFFSDVETTKNYVFVQRALSFRVAIPKSVFTSEAECSAFVELLPKKIQKAF